MFIPRDQSSPLGAKLTPRGKGMLKTCQFTKYFNVTHQMMYAFLPSNFFAPFIKDCFTQNKGRILKIFTSW
jgi:hypothetical protein